MSTSHLELVGAARRRIVHDPSVDLIGASRPSAVRALLARSITMTALALELRVRTRRRKPDTEVRLESLLRRQCQADHVRDQRRVHELRLAATVPGSR